MHVFIEIPIGSQPISHLLLGENFRKFPPNVKFPENLQPYLWAWRSAITSSSIQLVELAQGASFTSSLDEPAHPASSIV